jgi:hypothetical protein
MAPVVYAWTSKNDPVGSGCYERNTGATAAAAHRIIEAGPEG